MKANPLGVVDKFPISRRNIGSGEAAPGGARARARDEATYNADCNILICIVLGGREVYPSKISQNKIPTTAHDL